MLSALAPAARAQGAAYAEDVTFAVAELEKHCGSFFERKGIDWKAVAARFAQDAKKVKTDAEHLELMVRLVARLEDGHAEVRPGPKGRGVRLPDDGSGDWTGPGVFFCRNGKSILVKNAWGGAAGAGVAAGMEVVQVEGAPAATWLEKKIAELRDTRGYSTDGQAFYAAAHWGLAGPRGSTLSLELRKPGGSGKKATITRTRASFVPDGPAFKPPQLQTVGRQSYGKTAAGWGYIHLRDVPGDVPQQLDTMLGGIGRVRGLVVDFRGNGGGGCDHDALIGRFVPAGRRLPAARHGEVASAGEEPYGGPIVAIVDAGTRSAGETVSGMIKEYGRGYLIGESATAGMSSSKKDIELPSKLFVLHVSVASNMAWFNEGRGLEGVGVIPHEIVPYAAADLARGVDTLIARAEKLLQEFPQSKVAYRPAEYGWKD
jgi:C-terminal processing protease CtpA/Prc